MEGLRSSTLSFRAVRTGRMNRSPSAGSYGVEMSDPDLPAPEHRRPEGVDDKTVEALGKLSEALEVVENARGYLYAFHRLTGMGDLALGEAVDLLREAGHDSLAGELQSRLVGRNVIEGRWTFQVVEEYDDGYYRLFKELEAKARDSLVLGKRHLYEAEMKEDRRTRGNPDHTAVPSRSTLLLQELQQRLVELARVARVDGVRAALDDHQVAALDRGVRASARTLERHDLVAVAVDDERGHA